MPTGPHCTEVHQKHSLMRCSGSGSTGFVLHFPCHTIDWRSIQLWEVSPFEEEWPLASEIKHFSYIQVPLVIFMRFFSDTKHPLHSQDTPGTLQKTTRSARDGLARGRSFGTWPGVKGGFQFQEALHYTYRSKTGF